MEITTRQHIAVYKKAFSKEWCNHIIDLYENASLKVSRQTAEGVASIIKKDTHVPNETFPETLKSSFKDYLFKNILSHYNNLYTFTSGEHLDLEYICDDFKVQKTLPSEGYHVWHYESSHIKYSHRALVFSVYLNDVEEGGETEFLHQSQRVKPEQGTIVIFPASFTHIHRGNPPLSGEKYLVTGWISMKKLTNE